jgi:glycosyltransferase involved in cell wall biosynthesis
MLAPRKVDQTLNIIFNAQVSTESMGGGDKIVISIANELQKMGFTLNFYGSPEGIGMAKNNISAQSFALINNFTVAKTGFFTTYILRTLTAYSILRMKIIAHSMLWSASDFLPDVLPGFWYKLFHRNCYWVGNLFLRARNPFKGEVDRNFSTVIYFASQKLALFLYKLLANRVCVLCQEDFDAVSSYFGDSTRVCLISGGIDTIFIDSIPTPESIKYDACFIGRFHYQKGLPTLIQTWTAVNERLGPKELAVIGWGSATEVDKLKSLIAHSPCADHIKLLGFLDREDKLKVLKSSSILLFPSNFESWGVVIAEALGCGIPVIAFDLPQIKINFKDGVVWSKNTSEFIDNTLRILSNSYERNSLAQKAYSFSKQLDWKNSAEKFIENINI